MMDPKKIQLMSLAALVLCLSTGSLIASGNEYPNYKQPTHPSHAQPNLPSNPSPDPTSRSPMPKQEAKMETQLGKDEKRKEDDKALYFEENYPPPSIL